MKFSSLTLFACHSVLLFNAGVINDWHFYAIQYTLFQNGHYFSILLFDCKLALLASLSNINSIECLNFERGQNTKMAAILE